MVGKGLKKQKPCTEVKHLVLNIHIMSLWETMTAFWLEKG